MRYVVGVEFDKLMPLVSSGALCLAEASSGGCAVLIPMQEMIVNVYLTPEKLATTRRLTLVPQSLNKFSC